MDGNILNYYETSFDSVYVLLHPFIRPVAIAKEVFKPDTYPDTLTIANGCEAVRWSEVMSLTGLPSLAAVDIGLRSGIGALNKTFANEEFATSLNDLHTRYGIIQPDEGSFSPLLHNPMLMCFQSIGHHWAWIGDELGTQRKLYWIDDLKAKEAEATSGHCNVFSPDKSLLWTTHWDSHFSFICGSRDVLESLVQHMNFEGFFCNKDTEVYWSVLSPEVGMA
jgi:hypothetical protein